MEPNVLRPWWQLNGFTRCRGTDRFWRKVHKVRDPGRCWEWQNGRSGSGYGVIRWQGKARYAHAVAWELYHGCPAPRGKVIRHICDNVLCCRPSHLRVGTRAENSGDMVQHGRHRTGVLGHDQVRDIRRLYAERVPFVEICARFHVTQTTVWLIVKRRTYRHVSDAPIPEVTP